jgi:hypothetical protein
VGLAGGISKVQQSLKQVVGAPASLLEAEEDLLMLVEEEGRIEVEGQLHRLQRGGLLHRSIRSGSGRPILKVPLSQVGNVQIGR